MKEKDFINSYFEQMKEVIDRISRKEIEKIIGILFDSWKEKSNVFIIGNGGSAGTATHFACDLNKSANVEGKSRFRAFSLVDNIPLNSALVNDDGFDNIFIEQLKNFFNEGDVVIAISVHGGSGHDRAGLWSQNLLKAIQFAKENKGKTIGFSGFDGGALKALADVCVVVPSNSTPHVEAFHLALEHLIVNCLKEKIENCGS